MNDEVKLISIRDELEILSYNMKNLNNLLNDKLKCDKTNFWKDCNTNLQLQIQDTEQIINSIISIG